MTVPRIATRKIFRTGIGLEFLALILPTGWALLSFISGVVLICYSLDFRKTPTPERNERWPGT